MKTQILLCLLAGALSAAPVIRPGTAGVVNAASYVPLGTSGTGIAQGSFFVIFGSGLGPANIGVATTAHHHALQRLSGLFRLHLAADSGDGLQVSWGQ